MAFCSNCGAQTEGNFCPSCGKPVGGVPAAGPSAAGLQSNVAGALCYLLGLITGILFLVLDPYNKDRGVRFHAFQAIFFNVALILVMIVIGMMGAIVGTVIPVAGHALAGFVSAVVWLGSVVLWLFLMIRAYNGSRIVLPVIGPLAEKQAGGAG